MWACSTQVLQRNLDSSYPSSFHLSGQYHPAPTNQGVLQGVAFRGEQVLREKRVISLHEKRGPENRKNEVKLRPPLCPPLKHSMNKFRGPRMGVLDPSWLDFAVLGHLDFQSRGPKILIFKGFGTSGRKIDSPQTREIQPRRIQPPILGPLTNGKIPVA